jgi:hypothetical protein
VLIATDLEQGARRGHPYNPAHSLDNGADGEVLDFEGQLSVQLHLLNQAWGDHALSTAARTASSTSPVAVGAVAVAVAAVGVDFAGGAVIVKQFQRSRSTSSVGDSAKRRMGLQEADKLGILGKKQLAPVGKKYSMQVSKCI